MLWVRSPSLSLLDQVTWAEPGLERPPLPQHRPILTSSQSIASLQTLGGPDPSFWPKSAKLTQRYQNNPSAKNHRAHTKRVSLYWTWVITEKGWQRSLGSSESLKTCLLFQPCWVVQQKAAALPRTFSCMIPDEYYTYSITSKIIKQIQLVSKQNALLNWACPQ